MTNIGNYCLDFNREKAVEGIKYITRVVGLTSKYDLAMLCFAAEMIHLQEYGRPVFNDRYVALADGAACSGIFSIAADAERHYISGFSVYDNLIKANSDSDMSLLSESDISALDWAIDFSKKNASWKSLCKTDEWKSVHEASVPSGMVISFRLMDFKNSVLALKDGDSLWEYLSKE